jgi:hypothetical protein
MNDDKKKEKTSDNKKLIKKSQNSVDLSQISEVIERKEIYGKSGYDDLFSEY